MLSDKLDSTSKQNWQTKMERIETKKLETRSKKIATIWKILPNFFLSKRKWKSLFALSTSLHLAKLQLFKLDIKMKKTYFLLELVLETAFTSTISRIWFFGMAVMPFLCNDLSFLPKLLYHRNASLPVYLPIIFFSCCQKNKLAFV